MEDEFEEFVIEPFLDEEIDPAYEFDAPHFCDFTQPETFWEAVEAEHWFESAASCPPSPLVLKLRWEIGNSIEIVNTSANYGDGENLNKVSAVEDDSRGLELYDHTMQDTLQGKTISPRKSTRLGASTLMKPTASHLAKQKDPQEVHIQSARICRLQNQNSPVIDGLATKRQKLETGYLRKAAHLKHQALFTHKKPKTDLTDYLDSRPKVTVPRQPDLKTAHRAQRHNCSIDAKLGGQTNSSSHTFKARPLNRKILEAPSISFRKKKTPQMPEFQVFHLKTSERARGISNRNSISNGDTRYPSRPNLTEASKQEKCRMANKLRGSPDDKSFSSKGERGVFQNIKEQNLLPMELKSTKDKKYLNEPPIELFDKLSLVSGVKQTTKSQSKEQPISKGLKENRSNSFHLRHEDGLGQRRIEETLSEAVSMCGGRYITSHPYAGRCLDIC